MNCRADIVSRLGLPADASALQIFGMLVWASYGGVGGMPPSFVDDHFSEADYAEALDEVIADPKTSEIERTDYEITFRVQCKASSSSNSTGRM